MKNIGKIGTFCLPLLLNFFCYRAEPGCGRDTASYTSQTQKQRTPAPKSTNELPESPANIDQSGQGSSNQSGRGPYNQSGQGSSNLLERRHFIHISGSCLGFGDFCLATACRCSYYYNNSKKLFKHKRKVTSIIGSQKIPNSGFVENSF